MLIDKEISDHEEEIEQLQQEIVDIQELEDKHGDKGSGQNDVKKLVSEYDKQIEEQKEVLAL